MFILDRTLGIESRSVSATATNVTYTFEAFRNTAFTGLLLVDLQQPIPSTATDTLPILLYHIYYNTKSNRSQRKFKDLPDFFVNTLDKPRVSWYTL